MPRAGGGAPGIFVAFEESPRQIIANGATFDWGLALMGTLRWEKETAESARRIRERAEFEQKRRELRFAEATTSAQLKALQLDLQRQRAELALHFGEKEARQVFGSEHENELRRRRSADPPETAARKGANGATR